MTSVITNYGSMVASQTLKSINKDLSTTQNEISTGRKISSAKDGAAIWAISRYMETQVSELAQAQDVFSISEATVSVAEQIVTVLEEMKEIAIAGTSETADFAKLESERSCHFSGKQDFDGPDVRRPRFPLFLGSAPL